jgi:cyclic beta-1,2-glucan synthetase
MAPSFEIARAFELSRGRYALSLAPDGTGSSRFDDVVLTGLADPVERRSGLFVYLQDLDADGFWSVGREPAPHAERYTIGRSGDTLRLGCVRGGIEAELSVALVPDAQAELRRLRLRNRSSSARRLAVTAYAELSLDRAAAYLAHPAFSKLFVQTDRLPEVGALLASRRPRSAGERWPWALFTLAGPGALEHETDRAAFLGRGRCARDPLALSSPAPLTGRTGSVLDPAFALRRRFVLEADREVELTLLLGAADTRGEVEALAARDWTGALDDGGLDESESFPVPIVRPRFARAGLREAGARARPREPLLFANAHGGFSADGTEYVVRLDPDEQGLPRRPPMPWVNVIASQEFGCLVSESGAGCTWSGNSRLHRLTPFTNDPVSDPHGEALYLRDEAAGRFWSPQPGPAPAPVPYEARHGFGRSMWRTACSDLEQEVTTFVPPSDRVRITRVRLRNLARRKRRISLFALWQLVLGELAEASRGIVTELDPGTALVLARNPLSGDFEDRVTFAAAVAPPGARVHVAADREAFLGPGGSPADPAALREGIALEPRAGAGLDPCAALQVELTISAGGSLECALLLGDADSERDARAQVDRYRESGAIEGAFLETERFWHAQCGALQVETPSKALDLMLNGWLVYQTLSCRLLGRSAFYQSGGAFGFRDQLQDAAALVYARPDLFRSQIVLHAAHQFAEGDVLHWWHPPRSRGTRTRFSDDRVWLPYLTAFYVRSTGDRSVLDERAAYLNARMLEAGEDEAYLAPERSTQEADVYTHCCRALDRSLARGAHGLPLIGTGDWNDGMNRVGREGSGESVWLGAFLIATLDAFLPLCEARGDGARARRYRDERRALVDALNAAGWDGAWYRRAYYDDGTPLGTAAGDECRIDALVQAWAVIAGAAPPERAALAMDAVLAELVDAEAGLVKLLAPPFDRTSHDPGYIKGYLPGIRENGGQYTHAALWVVRALLELDRREEGAGILERLTPVWHGERTPTYKVEPYVVAADVYGVAPHLGRGGWTWYTGSAGWMLRVALESLLGFSLEEGRRIRLAPRVPDAWPGFVLRYRVPGGETRYEIRVESPAGRAERPTAASFDGAPLAARGGVEIPLLDDGALHRVKITLGPS